MEVSAALLLELGLVITGLTILGSAARRVDLSPIPLYLGAGLALGEGGLVDLPAADEFISTGATIGVVLLLLVLGLEFSIGELRESLQRHLPSAAVDLVLNATPGAVAGLLLGLEPVGVLALAGATWISSSGIVARLLSDLGRLANRETPAALSILVLEDFAMAAYLPVLAVFASGGTWWQAALGVAVALGALFAAFQVSHRYGGHLGRLVDHPEKEQLLLRVLGLTLLIAALAEMVHVSAAVGAFLVGLTLTGEVADRIREVLTPLRDLFAAIFFLAVGLTVDATNLPPILPVAVALAVVTSLTKLATGWYAASREGVGPRGRWRAGTVLTPRGEFSLVIIGLVGTQHHELADLVAGYVVVLAVAGPLLARVPPPRALVTVGPR